MGLRGSVAASQGNYNTEIGLPLSMVAMDGGAPYTVLEMGMRGPGQIRELAELARPKVGAVTAVALNHVGLFRSPEGVARAKAELVEALPEDGLAVLNADNRYMPLLKRFATCPTLLVGRSPKADVRLLRQQAAGREGSRMEVAFPGGQSAEIQVPWPGPGAAACALMATGLAWGLGLTPEEIARRFPSLPQGAARLKVRQVGDVTVVDDAYNAAPDSVRAALEFTAQAAGGRVVAVLGDMLELGDYSVSAHREVGRAAGKLVDLLVAVGTYAGETVGGALEIAPALPVKTYGTTDEVLEDGLQFVAPGDTVLLKASRGLHFERLVERLEEGAR